MKAGTQLFAEIELGSYENKQGVKVESRKIEGGFHRLDSKQCSDKSRWPRNEVMIAKSGVKMPESKPTTTAAKPATTTTVVADDMLDGVA